MYPFEEIIGVFSMQIDQNNCTHNIWNKKPEFIEKERKPEFIAFDLKSLKAKICFVYIGVVDIYSKRNNTAVLHLLDIYNKI